MKKSLALFTAIFGFITASTAQLKLPKKLNSETSISISEMPKTTDEFLVLRDKIAKTPEGAAAVFLMASIKFAEDPALGRHWVIIATDKNWLSHSSSPKAYRGFDLAKSADFVLNQVNGKQYIPFSYLKGTSAANGYQPGNEPYEFNFERTTDAGDGMVKVFVKSTGADTARPITLNKNDAGVWKGFEYSSIFVGVRPPVVKSKGASEGDF